MMLEKAPDMLVFVGLYNTCVFRAVIDDDVTDFYYFHAGERIDEIICPVRL